jgi:hypothetical protein
MTGAHVRTARGVLRLAVLAMTVVCGLYVLAVLTPAGQRLEAQLVSGARAVPLADSAVAAASALARLGPPLIVAVALLVALLARRNWRGAWVTGFSVLGASAAAVLPYLVLPRPRFAGVAGDAASFPSPLAAMAVAAAVSCPLVYTGRGLAVLAPCLPAVVAWMQLHGLWHRPSDLLAGAVIGVAVPLVVCAVNVEYLPVSVPCPVTPVRWWAWVAAVALPAGLVVALFDAAATGAVLVGVGVAAATGFLACASRTAFARLLTAQ